MIQFFTPLILDVDEFTILLNQFSLAVGSAFRYMDWRLIVWPVVDGILLMHSNNTAGAIRDTIFDNTSRYVSSVGWNWGLPVCSGSLRFPELYVDLDMYLPLGAYMV